MSDGHCVRDRVDRIIASYEARPTALIMILQEVQRAFSYLPREALEQISVRMDLALSQIYGVATFYKAFSLTPRGRHVISVCTGTACHVRNAESVVATLERELHVSRGETSADGEFTLETVNCVGCCALGPVVVAEDRHVGHVTVGDARELVARMRAEEAVETA
jgi:NADH-quinone oxidoreductase subunit E